MLSPNVLRGWSRGKVQGGDPERPKETMPPGGGRIFAAAPRDTLYIGIIGRVVQKKSLSQGGDCPPWESDRTNNVYYLGRLASNVILPV